MKIRRFIAGASVLPAIALMASMVWACRHVVRFTDADEWPAVFPDYIGVTVPEAMAVGEGALFALEMQDGRECRVERRRQGDTIWVTVSAWERGSREGVRYRPFPMYVSPDSIDPYVTYRLIEPGYESWSGIAICQRRLDSYEEHTIVSNRANGRGCINCHTFDPARPGRMLFHSRGRVGGTVFVEDGQTRLVDFRALGLKRQPTYPAWHPGGRYVAFSSNDVEQCFMLHGEQPIEVYDTESDIVLYDTRTGTATSDPRLNTAEVWETFPTWSPDGRRLYYCAADSVRHAATNRSRTHYRLMAIGFDPEEGRFEGEPQEVPLGDLDLSQHSVSHPRIHDHYLLFTLTDYGTFPIWHEEADLWLLDLDTGQVRPCDELNSQRADSFHSWSGSGRWVVFGSRRLDGRYTRLFISHFDGRGHFTQPFLLPQADPAENRLRLKSFNAPVFATAGIAEINDIKP